MLSRRVVTNKTLAVWGVMTIEMDEFDPTAASGGLDAQISRRSVVQSGALARPARLHPQSHRAPSRAARRVPAVAGDQRAGHRHRFGGRKGRSVSGL